MSNKLRNDTEVIISKYTTSYNYRVFMKEPINNPRTVNDL